MAKQSGLGDNLYVGGYDLSGDTQSLQKIGGGPASWDVQGIDKSAYERIGINRDGGIDWQSYFNDAAGQAHPVLSALPTADVLVSYMRGTTVGNPAACCMAKQVNYDPNRAADGGLLIGIQAIANTYGLEWGQLATPGIVSKSSTTAGPSTNNGASSAFGLQAYMHVFSLTGSNASIAIQESSDNGSGDPWSTALSFASVTEAPSTQRVVISGAVEQYLREKALSGTFSEVSYAIVLVRNDTAVVF